MYMYKRCTNEYHQSLFRGNFFMTSVLSYRPQVHLKYAH